MRLSRKVLILAKHESSYGTAPTFNPATDSFQVVSAEISFPNERIDRNILKPSLGRLPSKVTQLHAQLRFEVEVKGSGMDATNVAEPRIGRLIESCLFSKASEDDGQGNIIAYTYSPSSAVLGDGVPSIAFEVYFAGAGSTADKYTLVGCGGTFRFTGSIGRFPVMEFTFIGKLSGDPVSATIPTPTFDSTQPVPCQGVTFTFDSLNLCINEVSIDCGNTTALRRCMSESDGIKGAMITERNVTGRIDPEALLQSEYDVFAKFKNGNLISMTLEIGSEAGNQFRVNSSRVQVSEVGYADRDGIAVHDIGLQFVEDDSGNPEIEFRFY